MQLRVARHTARPEELVRFYRHGLALAEIGGSILGRARTTFQDPDRFGVYLVPERWEP
jgi:hypothetical protein